MFLSTWVIQVITPNILGNYSHLQPQNDNFWVGKWHTSICFWTLVMTLSSATSINMCMCTDHLWLLLCVDLGVNYKERN